MDALREYWWVLLITVPGVALVFKAVVDRRR
jgi:hypothetical protein